MLPLQHRLKIGSAGVRMALKQAGCETRVAMPGIVVANPEGNAFDPVKRTVSVQPAVQEVIRVNAAPTIVSLPVIDDVPIGIPCAGGYALTFPIAIGDECLLVFADMAYDNWWQNGGVQKQPEGKLYRHDLFDAFAWFGVASNPKAAQLANWSTTSTQLRSNDGTVIIDIAGGVTPLVKIVSGTGTPQALVNAAWLAWFTANVIPYLTAHGYAGPPPPVVSTTTVLEAE